MDPDARTTWTVGRLAGAPLAVSPWSLATLAVVVVLAFRVLDAQVPAPLGVLAVTALTVGVLVTGSVVLHELAHALVARRAGVPVERVVVTSLGARVSLDERALRPGTTALVALAGPALSLVLGGLAWAASTAVPDGGLVWWALLVVAVVNGATGAMNLLPAAPMDGGKVLAAGVWAATGDRQRGTVVSAWGGRVLAVVVVLVLVVRPLVVGGEVELLLVVLAVLWSGFLWAAAGTSLRAARSARRVGELDLRRLLVPAVGLPGTDTVAGLDALRADVGPGPVPGAELAVVLLGRDGSPVGYVDGAAAAAVARQDRARTPLSAVGRTLPAQCVVDAGLSGADALRAVATAAASSPVLVVVDAGDVLGLLHARDVVAALRDPA